MREGLRGAARSPNERAMTQGRDLEEIMRFDPEEGIAELDVHLDRLSDAAAAQGFKFDRHAARNELQAATFGRRRRATARLVLSPSGAIAIEVTAA